MAKQSDIFDFGFTSEEDILESSEDFKVAANGVEEYSNRIQQLMEVVLPFLDKLASNPNSDVIKWPGDKRVKAVEAFKKKLTKIATGEHQ